MKHGMRIALALLAIVALSAFAFAEGIDAEPEYSPAWQEATDMTEAEDSVVCEFEPAVEELGEVSLDEVTAEPAEAPEEGQFMEEAPEEEAPAEEAFDEQPEEEQPAEGQFAEDQPMEEQFAEQQPAVEAPGAALPEANALTYTGEPQALVSADGAWLYSMDGERYSADLPAAVDAGEYTVYYKPADDDGAQPQTLAVAIAKADVAFTPPVAVNGAGE